MDAAASSAENTDHGVCKLRPMLKPASDLYLYLRRPLKMRQTRRV